MSVSRTPRPRRTRLIGILTALAAALGLGVTTAGPAAAAAWTAPVAPWAGLCTATRYYDGIAYWACLDFSSKSRSLVRWSLNVNTGSRSGSVAVTGSLVGSGGTSAQSCPKLALSSGRRVSCYSSWVSPAAVTRGDFNVYVNASTALRLRVVETRIRGVQQEEDNWCGPAVAQAAVWTMGLTTPSQLTMADRLGTFWLGVSLPSRMDDAINASMPSSLPYRYVQRDDALSTMIGRSRDSISRNRPVPLLVRPHDLPGGAGGRSILRHYLLLHGWAGTISPTGSQIVDRFAYYDPWYESSTTNTLTPAQVNNAGNSAGITSIGEITYVTGG